MRQTKNRLGFASQRALQQRLNLAQQVRAIQHRAAEHAARIVSIGPLLLFSTATGDAWILDPADQLATRLAENGDPLDVYLEETDTSYAIGWNGHYRIEHHTFVYEDNEIRRLTAIQGYPTQQLLRAIGKVDRQ